MKSKFVGVLGKGKILILGEKRIHFNCDFFRDIFCRVYFRDFLFRDSCFRNFDFSRFCHSRMGMGRVLYLILQDSLAKFQWIVYTIFKQVFNLVFYFSTLNNTELCNFNLFINIHNNFLMLICRNSDHLYFHYKLQRLYRHKSASML